MKRIVIIPARGGSKRFPDKNITDLNGKPLIYHTFDTVLGVFDKIIFSTDSQKIADVANRYVTQFPKAFINPIISVDIRPDNLATDTSKVIDTVDYYFSDMGYGKIYDQIWLCLPTCPLRNREDVKNSQNLLSEDIDGVLSITDYEFPPTLGLSKSDDNFISDWHESEPWKNGNTRSQDHPTVYRPNGSLYGMWSKSFDIHRNFYKGKIKGYYMPRERSADIDNKIDLTIAKNLIIGEKNG